MRTFVRIFTVRQMNSEHRQVAEDFETKLNRLIFLFETTKSRADKLQQELDEANGRLMDAHKEIVELRAKYENLKMARMVGFSEEDKKKAYRRVSNFVRKIDSCLELLNN